MPAFKYVGEGERIVGTVDAPAGKIVSPGDVIELETDPKSDLFVKQAKRTAKKES